jgi:Na+-transporting NADH:ubiquinone oxidoreductase subunit F
MTYNADPLSNPFVQLDYSLTGANSKLAIEKGLAEAEWYQYPVPREVMRALLERRDGPAILRNSCATLTLPTA